MIDSETAREVAERELEIGTAAPDPHFEPLQNAAIGRPVVVHNLTGEPSYWLVPVEAHQRCIGFVRVSAGGAVQAFGTYYRSPDRLAVCPRVVTGITDVEAARLVAEAHSTSEGELSPPLFVHDGPPGREAWRVEVLERGRASRWIFATSAGLYDRVAGELIADDT